MSDEALEKAVAAIAKFYSTHAFTNMPSQHMKLAKKVLVAALNVEVEGAGLARRVMRAKNYVRATRELEHIKLMRILSS